MRKSLPVSKQYSTCAQQRKMDNLSAPEKKTYVVTGGASGLGAAYVEAFLKEGAKGIAILDIQVETGKKLAERLNKEFPNKVIFVKCDVSDEKEATNAFNLVVKQFKQLDVIINNAGLAADNPTGWRKACDVNWQGLVSFTLEGINHMRKDEGGAGGTIINVSSIAALIRYSMLPMYCGSKAAVLHFSQSIASGSFHESTGVRILTICLGATATPIQQGMEERVWDESSSKDLSSIACHHQKVESGVATVLKMFREGANGSVWLSIDDKPGKDITPAIEAAYKEFETTIIS